jgi:ubiquitin thioesterase OTU1
VAVLIVRRLKGSSGKKCEQQRQGHANSSSSGNNTAKRRQAGGSLAAASTAPGPLSKLKPSATCVPTADGTLAVVKRPIAADNSCLFNAVGYTMHQSLSRAPFLRRVVSNEVSGDPEKWSDAFLGMPNASYCSWIADPGNWGGGIELAILAAHYRREIYAWNIETGEAHVFGEDAGHARAVMVLYNGVHYDALAITPAPQAAEWEDTTEFNPRTKRGRAIVEAARTLVALNGSGGAANKSRPTSRAGSSSTTASATTTGGKRRQRPKQQQPSLGRLRCTECSSILESTEAAKEHASATGHQSFEQLV